MFVRASGEAVLGTQRCLPKDVLTKVSSRLRRGDFRYTTIHSNLFSYRKTGRASGETILGTQRYFPKVLIIKYVSLLRRADFGFWLRGGWSSLGGLTFINGGVITPRYRLLELRQQHVFFH